MKASDLHIKTKELENFESYERGISNLKEELSNVQYVIINGTKDARCIVGKVSLEVYQTEEWGSTIGSEANMYPNKLELQLNTNLSLAVLRDYEKHLIAKILEVAKLNGIEEDRFEPIFDKYIDLEKYKYGGWF